MEETLLDTLDRLEIGKPASHGPLYLFPLLGGAVSEEGLSLLEESLQEGTLRVEELDESGSVPELRVINGGARPVLILEENTVRFTEVSDRAVGPGDLNRIRLNRLDQEYEPLLEMCRLLLEGYSPGLKSGGVEQLAFVFDMNALFEEFVAEFLRRHKDRIRFDEGRRLAKVERQRVLGKLFGEFNMKVDLVLTDTEGKRFLVDTKYKILDPAKEHTGLAQSDFYQMYAYGTAGRRHYDDIVLLYPATEAVVNRVFNQDGLTLRVRQFDPKQIYDPETGRLNVRSAADELGQALSWDDGG